MTHDKSTTLRIFLSSPSDVLPERNRAEAIIRKISAELPDIELEAVRWEDSYYTADKSFQVQIDRPSDCDLVVCLFWSRLGSELPPVFNRRDGSGRTGTEWEFEEAMEAARKSEPATPDLLVYKKTVEPQFKASEAELGLAQKRALDAFWMRWFHDEDGHFVAGFDMFASADEFADKFEKHLREWLRRRTDGNSWDIATRGSPFRGLAPFDEAHTSVFFGRSTMIKRLAARLRSAAADGFPLVFVLGASGSGKSSLVRAGLIPHLRIAGVTEPLVARWRRAVTTPDSLSRLGEGNLLAGLVALLQGDGVLPELKQGDFANPEQLASLLAASPESATVSLLGALDRWASAVQTDEGHAQRPVTGLILVLDQFEEIFKLEDAERAALARAVSALVETGRVWLVATMRSDFYQALQGAPDWLALRERGRSFDVTAPSAADIREIVLAPTLAAGLRYEESGARSLAEDLEREAAAPGVLPMLQSALEELFNERDVASGLMTLASYDRLGGVQGVLAERAERVFGELDSQAQGALSEVLGKLADFDTEAGHESPVARAAQLSDFGDDTPARRMGDRLLAERLLLPISDISDAGENKEFTAWSGHVRVAHESLFLRWPRAQEQLAADRADLELRRRLNGDAANHVAAGAKDAKTARTLLLDGLRLAEGRDLLKRRPDLLTADARRFIADSDRQAKAKSRRAWTIAASLIVAFGLIAIYAGWSASRAQSNLRLAQGTVDRVLDTLQSPQMDQVRGFHLVQSRLLDELVPLAGQLAKLESPESSPAGVLRAAKLNLSQANILDARGAKKESSLKYRDTYRWIDALDSADITPEMREIQFECLYRLARNRFLLPPDIYDHDAMVHAGRELFDHTSTHGIWYRRELYAQTIEQYLRSNGKLDDALAIIRRARQDISNFPEDSKDIWRLFTLNVLESEEVVVLDKLGEAAQRNELRAASSSRLQEAMRRFPASRGLARLYLWELFEREREAYSSKDATRHAELVSEIRGIVSHFSGSEPTFFEAAAAKLDSSQADFYLHVDKQPQKALQSIYSSLDGYARLYAGQIIELPQFDESATAITTLSSIFEEIEKNTPESYRATITATHARELVSRSSQFLKCARDLGEGSTCHFLVRKATVWAKDRLKKQPEKAKEQAELLFSRNDLFLAAAVAMVQRDQQQPSSVPIADRESTDPLFDYCSAEKDYAKALLDLGETQEALKIGGRALPQCLSWAKEYDFDFYLRDSTFGLLKVQASSLSATGDQVNARILLKTCVDIVDGYCDEDLAGMLENGKGGPEDRQAADALRNGKKWNLMRFSVPVRREVGDALTFPFNIYINELSDKRHYKGIEDQAIWLERNRGLVIPQDVRDSFIKLENLARENKVSFPDLAKYALGEAQKTEDTPKSQNK